MLPALAFVAVWWGAVVVFDVPRFLLPAPPDVAARLVFLAREAELAWHTITTLIEIVGGFALGVVSGVATGVLFTRLPLVGRVLSPIVVIVQTAPKISLAPLLVLWLGLGFAPKIALAALVTFLPVMAGTMAGLGGVDRQAHDLARLLRLSSWARLRLIELPFAMPDILAGCRIGATQAVTAAVIGELIGARYGLGYLLGVGQENSDASVTIAAIVVLCALGWAIYRLVVWLETRLLYWHESRRDVSLES